MYTIAALVIAVAALTAMLAMGKSLKIEVTHHYDQPKPDSITVSQISEEELKTIQEAEDKRSKEMTDALTKLHSIMSGGDDLG